MYIGKSNHHMTFTPAIQRSIFLTVEEGASKHVNRFIIGVAIRNPTEKPVKLKTMSTRLFSVRLSYRTEGGDKHLWSPQTLSGQVITTRRINPEKTAVRTWKVPNIYQAYNRAVKRCRESSFLDENDIGNCIERIHPVNPNRTHVAEVEVEFPSPDQYHDNLTRRYDLSTNPQRVLDDEIPHGDEDAIHSQV